MTAPTGIERVAPLARVAHARPAHIAMPVPRTTGPVADVAPITTPPSAGVPGSHVAFWVIGGTLGWAGIITGGNWLLHATLM